MPRTLAWVDHAWRRAEVEQGHHVGGVLVGVFPIDRSPPVRLGVDVGHVGAIDGAGFQHGATPFCVVAVSVFAPVGRGVSLEPAAVR